MLEMLKDTLEEDILKDTVVIQGKIVEMNCAENSNGRNGDSNDGNGNSKNRTHPAQIFIDEEKGLISKVLVGRHNFVAAENVDMFYPDSCIIFPGFIDVHVHAREDASRKHTYKETFATMCKAAINGGVIAVCDMPNNPSYCTNDISYARKEKVLSRRHRPVDVLLYAGVHHNSQGLLESDVPYKVFIDDAEGYRVFQDYKVLGIVLGRFSGKHVSFHCEDPEILNESKDQKSHCDRRPDYAEVLAIGNAIILSKANGVIPKICHVSTKAGLELCLSEGVDFEIAPHHLYFTEHDYYTNEVSRRLLQMNPPLRTEGDRQALLNILRTGTPDQISRVYFGSDHAPHTREDKNYGASGVPHLDTWGRIVTWLVKDQQVSLATIQRICSENPGRFISQFSKFRDKGERFGKLEPGYVASITVLNLSVSDGPITKEQLKTRCKWSPFEGTVFPGRVEDVYVRGVRC